MELILERTSLASDYTAGKLYIDGKYFCDTIEDKVRDLDNEEKVYGKTAIPCGTYRIAMDIVSPRFANHKQYRHIGGGGTPTHRISEDNKSVTISFYELKFSATEYTSKAIHKTVG